MIGGMALFVGLFNNLALLIILVAVYGYLDDRLRGASAARRGGALGAVFAVFALGCMQVKIPVSEGVLVDQRNSIVILAGAFGGPLSGFITAAVAGAYRAYLGGRGIYGGLLGLTLSAVAGAFIHRRRHRIDRMWKAALVAVGAAVFLLPGFLPIGSLADGWNIMRAMALPYGTAIAVGLTVGGLLLENEGRRYQAQARLRASLAEREALITELYHRTNNNMQVISSFLSLRAAMIDKPETDAFAAEIRSRISAMALVYDKLAQSPNLSRIPFGTFVPDLVATIRSASGSPPDKVRVELRIENIEFVLDTAIALALVLNELIGNAFAHAFPGERRGTLGVVLERIGPGSVGLEIRDDGVGFPPGVDPLAAGTFGVSTAFSLVRQQLRGSIELLPGPGVSYRMSIRDDLYADRV